MQNRPEDKGKQTGETCLLSSERAALGQTGLSTGRLAQDGRAAGADDDGLCVGEDGGDGEAARALDVHEERSRSRDKVLEAIKVSQCPSSRAHSSNYDECSVP
jgi:hypothetical protein